MHAREKVVSIAAKPDLHVRGKYACKHMHCAPSWCEHTCAYAEAYVVLCKTQPITNKHAHLVFHYHFFALRHKGITLRPSNLHVWPKMIKRKQNRPILSCLLPMCQNEPSCETIYLLFIYLFI